MMRIGRLYQRRMKRNELGWRKDEVHVWEMPLVPCYEKRSDVLRRKCGLKEDSVFLVWKIGGVVRRLYKQTVPAEMGDYCGGYVLVQMKFRTKQYILIFSKNRLCDDRCYITVKNSLDDLPCRCIVMACYLGGDEHICINDRAFHARTPWLTLSRSLRAASISALISSNVHSRSPLAMRLFLLRSRISHARRPSRMRLCGMNGDLRSPITNGIVRVLTTCFKNTVSAFVIVSPSSSRTSSHWRLRSSSMRSVVVMYVSLKSICCQLQVLYHMQTRVSRGSAVLKKKSVDRLCYFIRKCDSPTRAA